MVATLRSCLVLLGLLLAAAPASAQWTRILPVQPTDIFSVWANSDTIVAGADTAVYVSTDAGATWKRSARVAAGVTSVHAVWVRNGRLYAGTFGQGVFVSDNLGDTWVGFNQGLVGGIANSQLVIVEFLVRGDSLFAATSGDGPWVRNLAVAGVWSHFGNALEPNQASNMNGIAAGGSRLMACGGFNGMVFFRDPGDADWTVSFLLGALAPGLAPLMPIWTGHGWVVGSNIGVFRSVPGQEPWTLFNPGLGTLLTVSFALRGSDLFANFGGGNSSNFEYSLDSGATWQFLETLDLIFTYKIAIQGTDLYAARHDGLWRRSIATVSVPGGGGPPHLRFAIAGSQPIGDQVRFRFDLPTASPVVIEVFDIAGRRAAESIRGSWPAGSNEVAWNARGLHSGVYEARMTAGGGHAVVRLVRAR